MCVCIRLLSRPDHPIPTLPTPQGAHFTLSYTHTDTHTAVCCLPSTTAVCPPPRCCTTRERRMERKQEKRDGGTDRNGKCDPKKEETEKKAQSSFGGSRKCDAKPKQLHNNSSECLCRAEEPGSFMHVTL